MLDQPSTLATQRLRWFQNHRVFSILIVIGVVIIAIGSLTDALDKIRKFAQRDPTPTLSSASSAPIITMTPPIAIATPVQSAAPILSVAPSQPSTSPSEAEQIVAEISAARPLQRRKVALTYVNIPVDWKLYFSSGDAYERLTTLNFDTSVDNSPNINVYAEVFTNGHENLALLDVGTPMRVRGKIEYVDGRYIRLKEAQVERWSNP